MPYTNPGGEALANATGVEVMEANGDRVAGHIKNRSDVEITLGFGSMPTFGQRVTLDSGESYDWELSNVDLDEWKQYAVYAITETDPDKALEWCEWIRTS